jgi:hypothetical protein
MSVATISLRFTVFLSISIQSFKPRTIPFDSQIPFNQPFAHQTLDRPSKVKGLYHSTLGNGYKGTRRLGILSFFSLMSFALVHCKQSYIVLWLTVEVLDSPSIATKELPPSQATNPSLKPRIADLSLQVLPSPIF